MKHIVVSGPRLHSGGFLLDLKHVRDVVSSLPEAQVKQAHSSVMFFIVISS